MASRYWVGGSANWDNTAGTKWATTSGGAGGAAVPTAADNVFFDANSGTVVVGVTPTGVNSACLNLDCTGFTGSFLNAGIGSLVISGSLTLSSTMTGDFQECYSLTFNSTVAGNTIKTFGLYLGDAQGEGAKFNGAGGEWTLQDDCSLDFELLQGTFNTNDKSISSQNFGTSGAGTKVLNLGASTITFFSGIASGQWFITGSGLTLNAGTSTIIFNNTSAANVNFRGGGKTYNIVWFNRGSSTGTCTIFDSNTISLLKISPGSSTPVTLLFEAGTTQTITSLICLGNNVRNTFRSTSSGSAWNLSASSGDIVVTNASLKDSHASGGARFLAYGTTDVSGNSGWSFSNLSGFFSFF